jgi:hypothetical protein
MTGIAPPLLADASDLSSLRAKGASSAAAGPGSLGLSLKNAPLSKADHGPPDSGPNVGTIGFADN